MFWCLISPALIRATLESMERWRCVERAAWSCLSFEGLELPGDERYCCLLSTPWPIAGGDWVEGCATSISAWSYSWLLLIYWVQWTPYLFHISPRESQEWDPSPLPIELRNIHISLRVKLELIMPVYRAPQVLLLVVSCLGLGLTLHPLHMKRGD